LINVQCLIMCVHDLDLCTLTYNSMLNHTQSPPIVKMNDSPKDIKINRANRHNTCRGSKNLLTIIANFKQLISMMTVNDINLVAWRRG